MGQNHNGRFKSSMLYNEPIKNQGSFLCITTGGLGDAILFSPLFRAIRNGHKTARVDLFVSSPLVREVYQNSDVIDKYITTRVCCKVYILESYTTCSAAAFYF